MLTLLIMLSPGVYVDIETDERAGEDVSKGLAIIQSNRSTAESCGRAKNTTAMQ